VVSLGSGSGSSSGNGGDAGDDVLVLLHGDDDDEDDADDIDRSDASTDSFSDAEREWRENLRQLESLVFLFLVPFTGKFVGRKTAYWVWARVMEWRHPVKVAASSKTAVAAGIFEAALL